MDVGVSVLSVRNSVRKASVGPPMSIPSSVVGSVTAWIVDSQIF